MTKPELEKRRVSQQQQRKSTVWTRDKISQLINLYREHECLWNYYTDGYKIKERRNKAIATICSTLQITQFDFGKKIHNLRNQFNSEMKKLERRLEEAGGNIEDVATAGGSSNSNQRCRWEHFESLMFLRNIIEPRPGSLQTANYSQQKKMRIKCDYNSEEDAEQLIHNDKNHVQSKNCSNNHNNISNNNTAATIAAEDVTEYHFEETTDDADAQMATEPGGDDFQGYEEDEIMPTTEREETYDQKYNQQHLPPAGTVIELPPHTVTTATVTSPTTTTMTAASLVPVNSSINNNSGTFISGTFSPQTRYQPMSELQATHTTTRMRDQWDAFGELIASEFRHLNSDVSRKRLKRKIMQAMLEVGDEDDRIDLNSIVK